MNKLIYDIIELEPQLIQIKSQLDSCTRLNEYVFAALKLGIAISLLILEQVLNESGKAYDDYDYFCPKCDAKLESKGLISRVMETLIGTLRWKRRAFRCPNSCEIGQIAPFDEKLGIKPYQKHSIEIVKMACMLAVFVPYEIASKILNELTGVTICGNTIWNWVQDKGKEVFDKVQNEINLLETGNSPVTENLDKSILNLPMIIGGDGVFVPFRPNNKSASGKTVWYEVKIGIISRIAKHINSKGKEISIIVRKRLVAVLGDINEFKSHLMLIAIKEGIKKSKTVVWISDGGKGFWGVYKERLSNVAHGILDFYHAAQNICKASKAYFDGRTKKSKAWFTKVRKELKKR